MGGFSGVRDGVKLGGEVVGGYYRCFFGVANLAWGGVKIEVVVGVNNVGGGGRKLLRGSFQSSKSSLECVQCVRIAENI